MLRRLVPLLTLLLLTACASQATTLVVVRHAEKQAGSDPHLTAEGEARAQLLVSELGTILPGPLTAVYHTPYHRTLETAAPAALAAGITPIVLGVEGGAEAHAREVAAQVKALKRGERVLIVGHSNTVPLILGALGMPNPPTIQETEYDHLFIVTLRGNKPPKVIQRTFRP